jgi:putative mRNA 3-end processing factor
MFDPVESDPIIPHLFISHAHYDHSRGFQFPTQTKYSTKETHELYEVDSARKVGNWQQVRLGRRLKLDEVEVEAHDAGHVLGSAQFEVITPEGNLVYASHINFVDTLLSHAAEVAPCDVLILETSFASPSQALPPRESTVAQMVKWALECVGERRIPTFITDPIGNAQELIRIFNTWTELRVIVHPRIARSSKVYEDNGIGLRYTDASTEESQSLIENAKCIVIAPRGFDATRFGDFRVANVSGWKSRVEDSATTDFRLGDQADFDQLLRFVEEARPKNVLTFRGASKVFAQVVSRKLGFPANELVANTSRPKPPTAKLDEMRVAKCGDLLQRLVETPGFTYQKQDLLAIGMREGFRGPEIEEALLRLVKTGALTYSELLEGYRLSAE